MTNLLMDNIRFEFKRGRNKICIKVCTKNYNKCVIIDTEDIKVYNDGNKDNQED